MAIQGLDISKWQGALTAATVAAMKAQGVKFCYIKVSQGTGHEDPQWRNSVPLLQDGGILVGPYHFVTTDKASDQYNWFNKCMCNTNWDLPPAMDCEAYTSVNGRAYAMQELQTIEIARVEFGFSAWSEGFKFGLIPNSNEFALWSTFGLSYPTEAIVDSIGRSLTMWMAVQPKLARYKYPAIYTNASSGNVIFKTAAMSRYPLWVANWNATSPLKPNIWKGTKYFIWQDNVVAGQPYGIDGKVDHDLWGDLFEFPNAPAPPPPPGRNYIDLVGIGKDGNQWAGRLMEDL